MFQRLQKQSRRIESAHTHTLRHSEPTVSVTRATPCLLKRDAHERIRHIPVYHVGVRELSIERCLAASAAIVLAAEFL